MNTPEPYERSLERALPQVLETPEPEPTVNPLSVHRDPSLQESPPTKANEADRRTVAWIRPSDLPTTIGAPWVGRGIDLQSELTRRARRTPRFAAATTGQRISRTSIARPRVALPTITSAEELGL